MTRDVNKDRVVPLEEPQSVQAQASAWLARLDGDNPSEADREAFKRWVNEDNAHIAAFEKVAAAWDELNVLTRMPSVLPDRDRTIVKERTRPKRWLRFVAVTATLVLGLFVSFKQLNLPPQETSYRTQVGAQKTVSLPDGSIVQLNTNSRIKVDFSGSARAVYLYQGEAHFDVTSNPKRPFEVYAGTGRVRAVGTAFSVTLIENSNDINVLVQEGVVEVAPQIRSRTGWPSATRHGTADSTPPGSAESRLIEAGRTVVFDKSEIKAVRQIELEEVQRRLAWQQGQLIFRGETLEEVVTEISRYTDMKILVTSEEARALRIGGQFQAGNAKAILNALERGFGLEVEYATDSLVYLSYSQERSE